MARCPFIDPNFDMEIDDPCPVCGMTGHIWAESDKCIGNVVDTGDELHQVLGAALNGASVMNDAVDVMKLAAELVQHEDFMGRCEAGLPLLAFVEHCIFCGSTYAERCNVETKGGCEMVDFKDTARALSHDHIGRRLEPEPMPEALKDAIATCYGLLHGVTTDDKRVHRARRGLLQWLTKDEQARGIDMARGVMQMVSSAHRNDVETKEGSQS